MPEPLIHVSQDGDAHCRHCTEHIHWDGLFAVWRDEDGLVSCYDDGPHSPVPPPEDIDVALALADGR